MTRSNNRHRFQTTPAPETQTEELRRLLAERSRIQESRFAKNTVMGYGYDWKMFCAWCEPRNRTPLPATEETVSLYLTDLLGKGNKVSTASRRKFAILHRHRKLEFPLDAEKITILLNCAQRQRGEKLRQMRALTLEELLAISSMLATNARACSGWGSNGAGRNGVAADVALRDRAIFVLGFSSALRRANIAALLLSDIEFTAQGLRIHIRREKQDRKGKGRIIGIPFGKHPDTCTVGVLRDWLKRRGMDDGPLFPRRRNRNEPMDGFGIWRIVKKVLAMAKIDATDCACHSLRAGFVTAAGEANIGTLQIAAHTGQSPAIVERYFRKTDPFRKNVCAEMDF